MEAILLVVSGVILGWVTSFIFRRIRYPEVGTLNVDERDPNHVKWKFELSDDTFLAKKKRAFLRINYTRE